MIAVTKKQLIKGRGRRPIYPFRDMKEVGDCFEIDCTGMSREEKTRKANILSTLCGHYGRLLGRTFASEITGDVVTVQLVSR
ncbi:hypothetical protein [Methylorubrum sp. SB2]|uniref:hypothetical protein n=1 Tax=Methylorubrum subtropicum TaxID=3138812 RepID=UPI00313C4B0F